LSTWVVACAIGHAAPVRLLGRLSYWAGATYWVARSHLTSNPLSKRREGKKVISVN